MERAVRAGLASVGLESLAAGSAVEVVVMTPGPANGWVFTAEALRTGAALFEGANVFANHTDALDRTRAGERRIEDLVGVISGVWWDPATGLLPGAMAQPGAHVGAVRATLQTSGPKGPLVAELAKAVVEDRAAGLATPNVGLSADAWQLNCTGQRCCGARGYG
jgi:hypothetical protein